MEVGSATGNSKISYLPENGRPVRTAFPPHIIQYFTDVINIPDHVPIDLFQSSVEEWEASILERLRSVAYVLDSQDLIELDDSYFG